MKIEHNISAAALTTFGVEGMFANYIEVSTIHELVEALIHVQETHSPLHILGGGSNVVVPEMLGGFVIHVGVMGMEVVVETETHVVVKVGGGENWHEFVQSCVDRGRSGLENLAFIPGTVGAAPIQNIGAYGVEQDACFVELEAIDRVTQQLRIFNNADCNFGYRHSAFKHELKDKFVITSVTYRLQKNGQVNFDYKDVRAELLAENIAEPTVLDVFNAVVNVRKNKLPSPSVVGNSGSFFKNPVVSFEVHKQLLRTYPEMVWFEQAGGAKLAAAWLIDRCGWKGYDNGKVGVHTKQALVIVRTGKATQRDVLALAGEIQQSVLGKFGVSLEREVNVW
ncbi:MAG: UDP-N-acetylmuramate dehydrogenase [Ignavibacteria bacterium]|nr:UDP-N-acetylmuramate dehydrogenase [Ignavibacteria bacterium]